MTRLGAIALPLIGMVLLSIMDRCEMSIYPGLRRKPMQPALQQSFDVSPDFLAQLMEENARRRLQQQFEQQLELINMQMNRQRQRLEQRERYRQQQLLLQERQRLRELTADTVDDTDDDYFNGNAVNGNELNINNNNNNNNINNNLNQFDQYDGTNGDFSYKYPSLERDPVDGHERIRFAVGPGDPRFYAPDIDNGDDEDDDDDTLDSQVLDEYEEYVPAETKQQLTAVQQASAIAAAAGAVANKDGKKGNTASVESPAAVLAPAPGDATTKLLPDSGVTATFHRIKPQTAAAAAVAGVNVAGANPRQDISALVDKLQKEGKTSAIINGHDMGAALGDDGHIVVRQHMLHGGMDGMEGGFGMYVVALIAGVSAAVTVGLIALGIVWYTLHSKTKAAADVDYPAYGVTGPNKDISPSGDRKLAQSAQMYHYQHQKQQIIAMENRQAVEGSCGLSDVESDDDNEEGDYTVYECPGLAPTGEMEVKNPLFLDETPVTPAGGAGVATPSTNITQATPQQPPTTRKSAGKGATNAATAAAAGAAAPPKTASTTASSSDEKRKPAKK